MRKIISALLLAAGLFIVPLAGSASVAAADQEAELKAQKSTLEAQLSEVQAQVATLESQSQALQEQLAALQADGAAMQTEYDQLTEELAAARAAMDEAVEASKAAIERVAEQQAAFDIRLSTMFEYRGKSTLEVLLESNSLDGFFTNMRLMHYVADADHQMLEQLKTAQEDAEAKQAEAEAVANRYSTFVEEKQQQLDLLAQGISLAEQNIEDNQAVLVGAEAQAQDIELSIQAYDAELDAYYAEQRRLKEAAEARAAAEAAEREAEASRRAAEQAEGLPDGGSSDGGSSDSGSGSGYVPDPPRGGLIMPLTSYHYISDYYGPRIHPITGASGMHWGVDFSAEFGTPVRACKSGTVIIANSPYQGQNYTDSKSGLGNYVTIEHDDGTATTYAHLKYVEVSAGQRVGTGERIGQVGSTGASTGAHLHLEYTIYGEHVDPLPYIS